MTHVGEPALVGQCVTIIVSDPFEFQDETGRVRIEGTVVDASPSELLIKLVQPLDYKGSSRPTALAAMRHKGVSTAELLSDDSLAANIMFLLAEVSSLEARPRSHADWFVIGSVGRRPHN